MTSSSGPLLGLLETSVLPFRETVQYAAMSDLALSYQVLEADVVQAESYASEAEREGKLEFGLTVDELASIRFYTQKENSFYLVMNRSLRRGDAAGFLPYLKLLLSGMTRLPSGPRRVFRSIDKNDDQVLTWWALTSTSISLQSVVQDPFLKDGNGTIFSIETDSGVNIGRFSYVQSEEEILLFPGTTFKVKGEVRIQNMPMKQLVEVANPGFDIFPRPRDVRPCPFFFPLFDLLG